MHVHWLFCISLLSIHSASAYHVTHQSSSRSSNRLLLRTAIRPGYCSNSCTSELNRLSMALPAVRVPLIQPTEANWWIWSLLAGASSLGIVLENTKIGAMLSSPLVTMGFSLILCNIGILPTSSPVYSTVLKVILSNQFLFFLYWDCCKSILSTRLHKYRDPICSCTSRFLFH